MIRHMSSVVRTVGQNFHKKHFSTTSRLKSLNFEKNLENLKKEQMKALSDERPVFLRDNALYLTITLGLGLLCAVQTVEALTKLLKTY